MKSQDTVDSATRSGEASTDEAFQLLRKVTDALSELLDDSQHLSHPNCDDGWCPVRDGRKALAESVAFFDRLAIEKA